MNRRLCFSVLSGLTVFSSSVLSDEDEARFLSQPMPGAASHRSAIIVFEAADSAEAELEYWPRGQEEAAREIEQDAPEPTPAGGQIYRFILPDLKPDTLYEYKIELDDLDLESDSPLTFRTLADWQYRAPAPDFTFITGSCAYLNDPPYDRPGKPYGQGGDIFTHMAESGADFMLWLGDNLYLRPADDSSVFGIWARYQYQFSQPELQELRSAMHHYAIWDDHDYGPNDSDKGYIFAPTAREAFSTYWANPSAGQPDDPGIYTTFTWSDCAFFLLDNRTHRDPNALRLDQNPDKTQLGARQKEWLKDNLLAQRRATFKFIVMGGQFLNEHGYESFAQYPADRDEILDFIREQDLQGVIFISGDRHFTELAKFERPGTYPIYELTSSPLSSGIARVMGEGGEANPLRVEDTLVAIQNFCTVEVTGEKGSRKLTLSSTDKNGIVHWTEEITEGELQSPTP